MVLSAYLHCDVCQLTCGKFFALKDAFQRLEPKTFSAGAPRNLAGMLCSSVLSCISCQPKIEM